MISEVELVETDVVVVGGGMAAMRAAISAAAAGARVCVVVRGRLGRGGSSVMTTGGLAAAFEFNGDSPKLHYADTMAGGADIGDEHLVKAFTEQAGEQVLELIRLGGEVRRDGTDAAFTSNADHSMPRNLEALSGSGTSYTIPLAKAVFEAGVQVFEQTSAISLLTDGRGAVDGLVALSAEHTVLAVVARATVLASGGCGELFSVSSNPSDVTGDGYSLAVRAGATLRDMEFIQFYPYRCIDPFKGGRVAIQPSTFSEGGRLYNSEGHRFMADYDPVKMEASTRDVVARAIYDQIQLGLDVNGGVRLDLSEMSVHQMEATNPKVMRALKRTDIDYRDYPFVVAPEAHYFMGGVRIDQRGQSSVKHLYAAGETAGGLQGANRLTNNALPEALVLGHIAGTAAAADALGRGVHELQEAKEAARATVLRPAREDAESLRRAEVQAIAGRCLGIVREEQSMREGLDAIREIRSRHFGDDSAGVVPNPEWYAVRSLVDVAEAALVSALARTESRGAHFRSDYPARDDEHWKGSVEVQMTAETSLEVHSLPERAQAAGSQLAR